MRCYPFRQDGNPTNRIDYRLPPLVVKVAAHRKSVKFTREAWFYNEIQSLQHTVSPRCFGMYQTKLASPQGVPPWIDGDLDHDSYPVIDDDTEEEDE